MRLHLACAVVDRFESFDWRGYAAAFLNNSQGVLAPMSELQFGESGKYGELAGRPLPEGLALVFVPALAVLLVHAEELNGAALNERQVLAIRDGSMVMVVGRAQVRALEEERGYADINAADAWASWLQLQRDQP